MNILNKINEWGRLLGNERGKYPSIVLFGDGSGYLQDDDDKTVFTFNTLEEFLSYTPTKEDL